MTARTILLLRHGRTGYNRTGRLQGQLDIPLDAVGRAQATAVAPLVRAMRPVAVLSSDLRRARDTALALALPVRWEPRLREIYLGDWQGLTLEESRERFPQEWAAWRGGQDVPRGGGETYAQLADRALTAVAEAVERDLDGGGLLVCVTHGGTARAIVAGLLGLAAGQSWRVAGLGNCRWSLLEQAPAGWRLREHGVGAAGVEAAGVRPAGAPEDTPINAPAETGAVAAFGSG